MNKTAVAKELMAIANLLAANVPESERWITASDMERICPKCATLMKQKGIARVKESMVKKAQWESLPKGWTEDSLETF